MRKGEQKEYKGYIIKKVGKSDLQGWLCGHLVIGANTEKEIIKMIDEKVAQNMKLYIFWIQVLASGAKQRRIIEAPNFRTARCSFLDKCRCANLVEAIHECDTNGCKVLYKRTGQQLVKVEN